VSDADADELYEDQADPRPAQSRDASTNAALNDRYGRGKARRFDKRFAWIAGGVLIAGGLVVVLFGGWQQGKNIEYRDLDYSVVDGRTVTVDVQVTMPADAQAICAVEAISESYIPRHDRHRARMLDCGGLVATRNCAPRRHEGRGCRCYSSAEAPAWG